MAITIKQQPEELSASGNRMYFLVHKMTAQIQLIESANKVVELPLMRLYPNADGDVDMDISKIIDNRLRPEFPGLETNEYCKLKGFTLQYKVVFTEEGNYIPINSTTTDILTAVKGKFPAFLTPCFGYKRNVSEIKGIKHFCLQLVHRLHDLSVSPDTLQIIE